MGDDKTIPTSLIDLRALSEPAGKLIDSVKDAIGAVYKPTHIRRVAKAEADAAAIHALGEVRVQDIHERAQVRAETRALRQQRNVESIVSRAVPELPATVSPDPVDPDWIADFFDQCANVSDSQMQTIWSKILAGEVARPGTFSPRTLHAVRLLRKDDADLFTRVCRYVWVGSNEIIYVHLDELNRYAEAQSDIYYASFIHLRSIGLVELQSYLVRNLLGNERMSLDYHGERFLLYPTEAIERALPIILLTSVGAELAPVAGATPDPAFPELVRTAVFAMGLTLEPQPDAETPSPQPKP
jgi:hypothetical protein